MTWTLRSRYSPLFTSVTVDDDSNRWVGVVDNRPGTTLGPGSLLTRLWLVEEGSGRHTETGPVNWRVLEVEEGTFFVTTEDKSQNPPHGTQVMSPLNGFR